MDNEADSQALLTDLYELTMLQAYFNEGMEQAAVFDLYIRRLPPRRNFLVACGLEQVLQYLENLRFSADDIDYLRTLGLFSAAFLDYLRQFRFSGSVRAVAEGTVVFPPSPMIEVTAPMPQAQLVETYLLNQVTFQTIIASKGARAIFAADGRRLVDFGSRRAHGSDAAVKAARALYIAGYESTSNVLAGKLFGIPVAGTMAHSYIQAHEGEAKAFQRFVESFPETVLLVDTYDTEAGVRNAAAVAREMGERRIRAVRLDSGDLVALAGGARRILDEAGLASVAIFASGGLDEEEIASLLAAGAPIDAFGVGTSAVVSDDAPALDSVYKLVSYAGKPRLKLSTEKATLPGRKQVFRRLSDGEMAGDTIGLEGEAVEGMPLLERVMVDGRRTEAGRRTLDDARNRAREQLRLLPPGLKTLDRAGRAYPVVISEGLADEVRRLSEQLRRREGAGGS